jgi:acetolactate synthase I/II/III large subunit
LRVADQIAEFISLTCSNKVFVLTGNGAMYLNDAIQTNKQLDYVCVRNEAAAPIAASSYSQASGRIGTVCVTAGPGGANAMASVVEAWVDSINILIISGQVSTPDLESTPTRSFGIAGIPIITYVKNFTKYSAIIDSVDSLEQHLKETLIAFKTGRPGPVWLDIPLDIQAAPASKFSVVKLVNDTERTLDFESRNLEEPNFQEIELALNEAKKPLILLGRGIENTKNSNVIKNWLEKNKIPYGLSRPVAYMAKISNEPNLGVLGVRGRSWSKSVLDECDLLIAVGCRLPTSIVGSDFSYLPKKLKIIQIDNDKVELERNIHKNVKPIFSTVDNFFMNKTLEKFFYSDGYVESWKQFCKNVKVSDKLEEKNRTNSSPLNLYWFVRNIEKYISSKDFLTTDAGSNYYASGQALSFNNGFKEITSGTFAAMGMSLPLAIGVGSYITKSQKVICITGDGSIELNIQELQTVATYDYNIYIFIINNGGYASMRAWQDTFFDGRYIGSTDQTGTKPMNFKKIAQAFNLRYEVIKSEKDFDKKIDKIFKKPGPIIVEVMCDTNQILSLPMTHDKV